MELTNRLREESASEFLLFSETVSFSETTGITSETLLEKNGMKHSITIEEVMTSNRLKHGVSTIADINTVEAIGDKTNNMELMEGGLFRDGEEVTSELDRGVSGGGQGVKGFKRRNKRGFERRKQGSKNLLKGIPRRR